MAHFSDDGLPEEFREGPPRPPDITVYAEPIHIGAVAASATTDSVPSCPAVVRVSAVDATLAEASLAERRTTEALMLGAIVSALAPQAGTLWSLVSTIDLGRFRALLAAVDNLASVPGSLAIENYAALKARTTLALRLLRVWTAISPGYQDDELLGPIDQLLADETTGVAAFEALCEMLPVLLHMAEPGPLTPAQVSSVCSDAHKASFAAAGIQWPMIVALSQGLFEVFKGLSIST